MRSEISQVEKDKNHDFIHMWDIKHKKQQITKQTSSWAQMAIWWLPEPKEGGERMKTVWEVKHRATGGDWTRGGAHTGTV